MSTTASQNFRTEFDPLVKQAYQGSSLLMGKVRTRTNVNAKTCRFPKLAKGIAQERIPQTDVIPMNVTHSYADCTIKDWIAPDYSAVEDLDKLSFDEKRELVQTSAKAIGRRLDQIVIDAVAASAFATQVSDDLGGTDSGLNLEKILRAKRLLDANGVGSDGRIMLITARALEDALNVTEIGSSDYNVTKALAMGELKKFAGFEFITMEDRTEGGIPLVSGQPNVRNCFAFHKDAVGLAMSSGINGRVEWSVDKQSWLISTAMSAGAVTVDTDGVIDVLVYEA